MRRNDPPNLAVIDRAIERIKTGANTYSCLALEEAVLEIEFPCAAKNVPAWRRPDKEALRIGQYVGQYYQHVHRTETYPQWWNHSTNQYRAERIAALKSFRKACIAAAKKGQP